MLMLFIKFITSATLILFPNMSSIRFWSIPYSALSSEILDILPVYVLHSEFGRSTHNQVVSFLQIDICESLECAQSSILL